ncbi:MAG: hypothetical protein IKJ27_03125 [Clostridia bacterium]|nr:hypothetical protein [Clostridia bacterium]
MKKLFRLAVITLLIIFSAVLTASAETPYSYRGLSFSVPEFLKNDVQWATNADYAYAFCDSETKMEFNVSVYENEGYSYVGLDDEALSSYAQSLEESYEATITVENYSLSNGFSGIKINLDYEQGEKGYSYWFATDELCYDLDFVFYDESYTGYAQQIMSTVAIDGMPCVDVQAVSEGEDKHEVLTDGYIYESEDRSYTYEGLTLTLPEILIEDRTWAEQNGAVSEWITDDMSFEVILNTDTNTSPAISFHDFRKSILEPFYRGIEESIEDEVTSYSWERTDNEGFGGAKLILDLVDSEGYAYRETLCCFSTAEKLYYVIIIEYDDSYNGYVDGIVNSVRIDGKPYTQQTYVVLGVCICAVIVAVALIAAIVAAVVKKKKSKAEAELSQQAYMPVNMVGVPVYFTPDGQPYGVQPQAPMPPAGYQTANGCAPFAGNAPAETPYTAPAPQAENITKENEVK